MSDECALVSGSSERVMATGRLRARVRVNQRLGSTVWLTLEVPGWPGARPGQFALLQTEPSSCFLARAVSVAMEEDERVSFLIAPVGAGTEELAATLPGAPLWVLGPLGNGFPLEQMVDEEGLRLLLVGGGVGVAPFPLLLSKAARLLAGRLRPVEIVGVLGFRDAFQAEGAAPVTDAAALADSRGVTCRCVTVTEDGSVGVAGLVTDMLRDMIRPHDRVAVCGPPAMAEAVWSVCRAVKDVRAWFSLETVMACGVGSCHGCVLPLADGSLARVCADGPVFAGETVWPAERALPPAGDAR
jgi:dihydroorotate dehydrogenase electron transfer subunit